jgi:hypothetical protein
MSAATAYETRQSAYGGDRLATVCDQGSVCRIWNKRLERHRIGEAPALAIQKAIDDRNYNRRFHRNSSRPYRGTRSVGLR